MLSPKGSVWCSSDLLKDCYNLDGKFCLNISNLHFRDAADCQWQFTAVKHCCGVWRCYQSHVEFHLHSSFSSSWSRIHESVCSVRNVRHSILHRQENIQPVSGHLILVQTVSIYLDNILINIFCISKHRKLVDRFRHFLCDLHFACIYNKNVRLQRNKRPRHLVHEKHKKIIIRS